jgi:hypothetical protein
MSASERLLRYRDALDKSGGRRILADLDSSAVQALDAVVARDGGKIKDAISRALVFYAASTPVAAISDTDRAARST